MLGKLLKYDFKSSYLYLLVCYAIYIVLTIMFTLSTKSAMNSTTTYAEIPEMIRAFGTISVTALWICSMVAVGIVTYVMIIYRFYSNMVSDQGYLSLTLPVTTRAHMLSKLISGLAFQLLTGLVLIGGIMITGIVLGDNVWKEITWIFQSLWEELSSYYGIIAIINMILTAVRGLLMIYFSICVGQLFNKHKIWGSIGTYLGLSIVLELFVTIAAIIVGAYRGSNTVFWIINHGMTWVNTIWLTVQIGVYFFLGAWILEKKANLE